jgi:uncharacterized membrane protein YphA (DoxX/SURF4 family)
MSKLSITGIVFVTLGIVSGFIQQRYYGYMDAEGVIHDSFFLPLAFILAMIGGLLLLISMVRFLIRRLRKL